MLCPQSNIQHFQLTLTLTLCSLSLTQHLSGPDISYNILSLLDNIYTQNDHASHVSSAGDVFSLYSHVK
jgi:hypothetical protein